MDHFHRSASCYVFARVILVRCDILVFLRVAVESVSLTLLCFFSVRVPFYSYISM